MKLKSQIKELLINSQWNRNSDYALYADYIKLNYPGEKPTNYYNIMMNYKAYGIYSIKAVERTRRYLQTEAIKNGDMSILSDKQIRRYRDELQTVYKANFASQE